tara:strand:+ start:192 stop:635 length:444 start_codon:yes stop_codon:yes gene_type:complete
MGNDSSKPSPPFSNINLNATVTVNHTALNQLIPSVFSNKSSAEIINELLKNNCALAHKIIDVYYRIKRNVEYMNEGKLSLYPVTPYYATSGTNLLNSRASRHYFYLIHKHPDLSFGHTVLLATYIIQNNKMRLIQNTKGLSGPRFIK